MIALIDIGNTRTKFCFFDQKTRTPIQIVVNNSFNQHWFDSVFIHVKEVIVANVSSTAITEELQQWCQHKNITYKAVVSERENHGVISAYTKPEQLGVDRWLTLVATASLYPQKNILIIDAGTATTVDLLSASGQHIGGWILAGIDTLFTSILANTNNVQADHNVKVNLSFGITTSENVNNACWAATIGIIKVAITQAQQQSIVVDEIVLTGGNGEIIASLLASPLLATVTVIDDLIFQGLHAYR